MKKLFSLITHAVAMFIGFIVGVYMLPILIQPPAPEESMLDRVTAQGLYTSAFRKDIPGSDALHYADGVVTISANSIAFRGKVAPGPDYRLYLSPTYVDTAADFLAHKIEMVQVGEVKTFDNFLVELPRHIDPSRYTTVIVWCESFEMFISAAQYQLTSR